MPGYIKKKWRFLLIAAILLFLNFLIWKAAISRKSNPQIRGTNFVFTIPTLPRPASARLLHHRAKIISTEADTHSGLWAAYSRSLDLPSQLPCAAIDP